MSESADKRHPDDYPRVALVTGAARRIGREVALDLAEQGWAVAVHFQSSEREAQDVVERIRGSGGKAAAFQADLAREDETQRLVPQVVEAMGHIGLLVNNASRFELDTVEDASRESWDLHLEPNLRAPFVLTQAFAGALPDDSGGLVINLLDERVWDLPANYITYTLSKSGLWTLTRTLARALAPRIRVNGIGPGYTLPAAGRTPDYYTSRIAALPLARGSNPVEICTALRFFIATKSVTGQMIALDGGQHLGQGPQDLEG